MSEHDYWILTNNKNQVAELTQLANRQKIQIPFDQANLSRTPTNQFVCRFSAWTPVPTDIKKTVLQPTVVEVVASTLPEKKKRGRPAKKRNE